MLGSIRAAAILAAAVCSVPAMAQDGENDVAVDRTPQDCIVASRIDGTEVIDDNTIIFHMRGTPSAFVNYLPQRCPNLAREDSFAYERRTSQLCDDATITVLEFSGLGTGFTCRLGQFHPVTQAEVEEIRRVAEQAGSNDGVDVEEVELPDDENDRNDDRDRNERRNDRNDRNDREGED